MIFPGCMKRASGPGAGCRLPALLCEGVQAAGEDPGVGGPVSPTAGGWLWGGWHKGVTPPRTQKGMFGAGDGRAQRWLLMDHHVMPSDEDARGDRSPQFGDPHLPGGHRDWLRGPSHPGDIPALPRSPWGARDGHKHVPGDDPHPWPLKHPSVGSNVGRTIR